MVSAWTWFSNRLGHQLAIYDPKAKKITIKEDQIKKDKELKADRRTAYLMVQIANSIDPSIVMEASVPSDFVENKLPLLNCKIWLENTEEGQKFRYEHFKKSMGSILKIQMPGQIRRATKLLNTSIELGKCKQGLMITPIKLN